MCPLIELVGVEGVGAASWTSQCLLALLVLAIEIWSLLVRGTVLEDFRVTLVVQHVELLSHRRQVLRLDALVVDVVVVDVLVR